jgi:hypothetical protein
MKRASGIAFVLFAVTVAHGFYRETHIQITADAFAAVTDADNYADRHATESAAVRVDAPATNDDANQYRHSMRPSGKSLHDAQTMADDYMKRELDAAVQAARLHPPDKVAAGRHLGLVLHAIQDRKHNWTSCGPDSNPADSKPAACDSSKPCPMGKGNHGLIGDCLVSDFSTNFQRETDKKPFGYTERPLTESIAKLNEFVARVRAPAAKPTATTPSAKQP